ncbi:MAG: glycoside hydrolase family 9 protein [Thermoflexales bacterium]|nr:glycoside hydrolase family 9 protein [Thermoflexales bacterium]
MPSNERFRLGALGGAALLFGLLAIAVLSTASVTVLAQDNLLTNGDFSSGFDPWWITSGATQDTSTGELCVTITNGGSNRWDIIVGQPGLPIEANSTYTVSFDARANMPNIGVRMLVQLNQEPWTPYIEQNVTLSTDMQTYTFVQPSTRDDPAAVFQFQMGGQGTPVICFDNVVLEKAGEVIPPTPTPTPVTLVRVNQAGYQPNAPKRAAVVNDAPQPITWELLDNSRAVVLSGTTTVYGQDEASGDPLHIADFSAYTTEGVSYTLRVLTGTQVLTGTSYAFDIDADIYQQLKYDALAYFYHNRSGIPITMPYAGGEEWTRPAGHVDVAPNRGDTNVTCFSGLDPQGRYWPGCNYSLDVSGGWYDAGDHGKYVVNGGITVWTLLNQYERSLYLGTNAAAFADGTLNIPENDNGVPDLLDEARWELDFFLRMQVPANATGSLYIPGLVHHKVADVAWTGLPLAPHNDAMARYLYPPSTAATLNMAATAAQAARIWSSLDVTFSQKCLAAAENAWAAAVLSPTQYAVNFAGSGMYGDNDVSDEFYWAAAELFITTGKADYRSYLISSTHFLTIPIDGGDSMAWPKTAALGTISLATVPNDLAAGQIRQARKAIQDAADVYVAVLNAEGYRLPFKPDGATLVYPWGSNSFALNNMIVLGLAYDFSGNKVYRDSVSEGMDYVMGRNPMEKSYISGYGEDPLQNPHHRFWARQLSGAYPPPPPGVVSGGPNSRPSEWDPVSQARLPGCSPQKCYVDDTGAWAVNEVAINWNGALAWVTAFMDERARRPTYIYLPIVVKNF